MNHTTGEARRSIAQGGTSTPTVVVVVVVVVVFRDSDLITSHSSFPTSRRVCGAIKS
jgi:hypothetical protein